MDINLILHELLNSDFCGGGGSGEGGSGGGVLSIKTFARMLEQALQEYTLKSDYIALEERVARLERLLAAQTWETEFVMEYDGTNSIDLSKVLSESEFYSIANESAGGPNADGHKRTIAVYVVTKTGKSILLPWGRYGDVNTKSADKLREEGINYMPAGLYYLDGEGVLQCNIQEDTRFRIARTASPID